MSTTKNPKEEQQVKLKDDYVIYDASSEERIAVATGDSADIFNGLLRANKTAGLIMEYLGTETTEDEIASRLMECYEVDENTVRADVSEVLDTLRSAGAIEE